MTYINYKAISNLAPEAKWYLGEDTYESLEWYSDDLPKPTLDELVAETQRIESEVPWKNLRNERNQLLAETDYLALVDVTLTDEMRAYRQALRDLPANTVDPANPVWPTKPE